jgi:hypothetical protein
VQVTRRRLSARGTRTNGHRSSDFTVELSRAVPAPSRNREAANCVGVAA